MAGKRPIIPFWRPWGPLGCLWRTIVFLLGLLLLCLIFSLIGRCGSGSGAGRGAGDSSRYYEPFRETPFPSEEDGFQPGEPLPVADTVPPYEDRHTAPIVDEWNDSIPGVVELPAPADNFIPPYEDRDIIENPADPYARVVGGQIAVFFNSKDLKNDMASFARQFKQAYPEDSHQIAYYNPTAGSMILVVPQESVNPMLEELPERIPGINFIASTNEIMTEREKPSEQMFNHPVVDEYLKLIQAYDAWDITKGDKDVKVAIVDSYFDLTNPEIGERFTDPIHIPSKTRAVLPPKNSPSSAEEFQIMMHGSHVAGAAIGGQDNGLGASGIAPECSWIPVSLGGDLSDFNIIEGILYAIYKGADVVNVSLGRLFPEGLADQLPLEAQAEYSRTRAKRCEALWEYVGQVALDHNCVIVVSAGNETLLMGMDPMNRNDNMIKVEAVDGKGMVTNFSNYGDVPEEHLHYSTVSAPGHAIWSVIPRQTVPYALSKNIPATPDGFGVSQGTSMAAPIVTGAVALLKSVNKNLTGEEIKDILVKTAKPIDTKSHIGPVIQIADALKMAESMKQLGSDSPEGTGEMLNFDDVVRDHNSLLGTWRSTRELVAVDPDTGEKEKIWTYFIFTSPNEGRIEHHTSNTRQVYAAPIRVSWDGEGMSLQQTAKATCPGEKPINIYRFSCRPNADRLLETTVLEQGREKFNFLLEKVR